MKKLILIIAFAAVLLTAGILEQVWLHKQFGQLEKLSTEIVDKCTSKTITESDVKEFGDWWENKKRKLHIFIPHSDISNIDFWIAEGKSYVETKNYDLASAQFHIVLDASKTIINSYKIRIENIF